MTRTNWLCFTLFAAILALASYCGQSRAATAGQSLLLQLMMRPNASPTSEPAKTASAPIEILSDACTTVQHDGVTQFQAKNLTINGNVWDFRDPCNTPPPPPDPGAYSSVVVNWLVYPSTPARSTDARVFGNIFGRINSLVPAVGWDFAHGATVQLVDTSARYYRMHVSIPANAAPTNGHALKAVSYGKSPANLRAKFAIVATGAPWPTGDATGCYKPVWPFDDTSALTFAYHAVAGPYRCAVGNEFDVLVDAIGNGTMALSWQ